MTLAPSEELSQHYYQRSPPEPLDAPDPLSTCGLPPPTDRLYIDMNGILHGCSHNNIQDDLIGSTITEDEIFRNVCFYLERIVGEMVQPNSLVYMAIDGVAPRAKLNQQRSRRYRSSDGGEIEHTVLEAYAKHKTRRVAGEQKFTAVDDTLSINQDGYVSGKFESHQATATVVEDENRPFHSNSITPGTPFFAKCQIHLEHFIKYKLSTDPKWQALTIIFSGSHVPGEGEHKIMDFMRRERARPDYDPNLRHCIVGQDGDLIMLGLVTHEPNLVLLRERVVFDMAKNSVNRGIDGYLFNPHFEFLHLNVLRDYLAYEFETAPLVVDSPWDLERTVDDFVFMTFFCGNDFLPHLPAVDIGDEAFDLLFYTYKRCRRSWLRETAKDSYLTHQGNIPSGERLEHFLELLGSHESPYYDNKKEQKTKKKGVDKELEEGQKAKEEDDRASYRDMLANANLESASSGDFTPVMSGHELPSFQASTEDEEMEEGFIAKLGKLVQSSLSPTREGNAQSGSNLSYDFINDQDLKGRYYYDKFRFTPFDKQKHIALRKAYLEGLVWNLKYYYEGCVSWEWFYPYHYGPMLSDLTNIDQMLSEISFEGQMGNPLKPFEQLMGCMPPSSSYLLPKPYRALLTSEESPIHEFYPSSFTVDMNGKRWPWEAVVLLPFIDSKKLIHAATNFVDQTQLTGEEQSRNTMGKPVVFLHDASVNDHVPLLTPGSECFEAIEKCSAKIIPLESTIWNHSTDKPAVFESVLKQGVVSPLAGFSSLTVAPNTSLWKRRIGLNVFGMRSRYRTAVLQLAKDFIVFPPIQNLAPKLIGTIVFINYPHLVEGFVTSVSNEEMSIRGMEEHHRWTATEREMWVQRSNTLTNRLEYGEGYSGTGGWNVPNSNMILSVRPFQGLVTLDDGTTAKTYAKFEVDVPLNAGLFTPTHQDTRISNISAILEDDLFFVKKSKRTISLNTQSEVDSNTGLLPSNLLPDTVKAFDGPIVTSLSDFFVSGENTHHSLLPPMEVSGVLSDVSSGRSPLLPPLDALPVMSGTSRIFPTKTATRPFPNHVKKRAFSTSALLRPATRTPQGRVLAMVGVVAMFAAGFADAVGLVTSAPLLGVRGGGGNAASPFYSITPSPPPLEFAHGTTTLSFVFQGGIVAAVDSRASMGNFVGSKTVQKVLCINSHMLGTMAGGAADCSFWIRKLKAKAELLELTSNKRMSVARASRILSNDLYENRGLNLSVGTMVMGQDENGMLSIYYVDNTGVRIKGEMFSCGSGSTFAFGILDQERRFDMTEEEAIALGVKAIRHATFRDAYSGGYIGVYLITKDGWRKVFSEDLALSSEVIC